MKFKKNQNFVKWSMHLLSPSHELTVWESYNFTLIHLKMNIITITDSTDSLDKNMNDEFQFCGEFQRSTNLIQKKFKSHRDQWTVEIDIVQLVCTYHFVVLWFCMKLDIKLNLIYLVLRFVDVLYLTTRPTFVVPIYVLRARKVN